ncbi:unnamed protein product [Amoebophrya sp. A25]|nr:unnamed protein product [Amoebophrya sp. A25]|eukprot:GSA25T00018300001.1
MQAMANSVQRSGSYVSRVISRHRSRSSTATSTSSISNVAAAECERNGAELQMLVEYGRQAAADDYVKLWSFRRHTREKVAERDDHFDRAHGDPDWFGSTHYLPKLLTRMKINRGGRGGWGARYGSAGGQFTKWVRTQVRPEGAKR